MQPTNISVNVTLIRIKEHRKLLLLTPGRKWFTQRPVELNLDSLLAEHDIHIA